jgi:hypothetical protein
MAPSQIQSKFKSFQVILTGDVAVSIRDEDSTFHCDDVFAFVQQNWSDYLFLDIKRPFDEQISYPKLSIIAICDGLNSKLVPEFTIKLLSVALCTLLLENALGCGIKLLEFDQADPANLKSLEKLLLMTCESIPLWIHQKLKTSFTEELKQELADYKRSTIGGTSLSFALISECLSCVATLGNSPAIILAGEKIERPELHLMKDISQPMIKEMIRNNFVFTNIEGSSNEMGYKPYEKDCRLGIGALWFYGGIGFFCEDADAFNAIVDQHQGTPTERQNELVSTFMRADVKSSGSIDRLVRFLRKTKVKHLAIDMLTKKPNVSIIPSKELFWIVLHTDGAKFTDNCIVDKDTIFSNFEYQDRKGNDFSYQVAYFERQAEE